MQHGSSGTVAFKHGLSQKCKGATSARMENVFFPFFLLAFYWNLLTLMRRYESSLHIRIPPKRPIHPLHSNLPQILFTTAFDAGTGNDESVLLLGRELTIIHVCLPIRPRVDHDE